MTDNMLYFHVGRNDLVSADIMNTRLSIAKCINTSTVLILKPHNPKYFSNNWL